MIITLSWKLWECVLELWWVVPILCYNCDAAINKHGINLMKCSVVEKRFTSWIKYLRGNAKSVLTSISTPRPFVNTFSNTRSLNLGTFAQLMLHIIYNVKYRWEFFMVIVKSCSCFSFIRELCCSSYFYSCSKNIGHSREKINEIIWSAIFESVWKGYFIMMAIDNDVMWLLGVL